MSRGKNLLDQRFGMLTVKEKTEDYQDRYWLWRCACDCGGEILVNTKRLSRGTVSDCGCVPNTTAKRGSIAEDLTGRVFGQLTVLTQNKGPNKRTHWLCRCDCGNETVVSSHDLKAGTTKSCGCAQHLKGRYFSDITQQKFGRLLALYPTDKRDQKSSVYWHCRCDCGNELDVTQDGLVHGNYRSCGCLKKEIGENLPNTLHFIDGTCVEMLDKRKQRSDNSSGFRGVYLLKNGDYRAGIGFKGARYNIGTYKNFDEAVQARLEIERLIHDGFVKAYYIWQEKTLADPAWAEENPLIFDVEKINGDFHVVTNMADDIPPGRALENSG